MSAAPSNGAQKVTFEYCNPDWCEESNVLTHYTTNNNKTSYMLHYTDRFTYLNPTCVASTELNVKAHDVFELDADAYKVQHIRSQSVSVSVSCFGLPASRCLLTDNFQVSNYEVKYQFTEEVCTLV